MVEQSYINTIILYCIMYVHWERISQNKIEFINVEYQTMKKIYENLKKKGQKR